MVDADYEFFVWLLSVELFDLGNETVFDVFVDDLVVFGAEIVDDKILA